MPALPPTRNAPLSPTGESLFTAAFLAAGLAIFAVAVGWIHLPEKSLEAPRWIIAALGLAFMACGFIPLANRLGRAHGRRT